jgi:hypothetical protein
VKLLNISNWVRVRVRVRGRARERFFEKKHWPELNGKPRLSDQVNKYNKYKDQSEQPV